MDDYDATNLQESKNEWTVRLMNVMTPLIIEGFRSIFDEAWKVCEDNDEIDKYLMTFQNYISRIPKWNEDIIDSEKKRILEKSGCQYIEDLITCVHVIQLKLLTCVRVGSKQKKIDINIPKLNDFIHKVYKNVARKLYSAVYLFEKNIPALQTQKNNREIEMIVKECIVNTVRESIPVDTLLKAYLDVTKEEELVEEVKSEKLTKTPLQIAQEKLKTDMENNIEEKIKNKAISPLDNQVNAVVQTSTTESSTGTHLETASLHPPSAVPMTPTPTVPSATMQTTSTQSVSVPTRTVSTNDIDEDKIQIYNGSSVKLDDLDVHNVDNQVNIEPDHSLDDMLNIEVIQ